jgi:hypothetical protein
MGFLKTFVDDIKDIFKVKTEPKKNVLCFGLTEEVALGITSRIEFKDSPHIIIKPTDIIFNVPCENLFFITSIKIGNVECQLGDGYIDAFTLNNVNLNLPCITPGTNLIIKGIWTNKIPVGYEANDIYQLTACVTGEVNWS